MTTSASAPGRTLLVNLQLLRFVAATMVVLLHGESLYFAMGGKLSEMGVSKYFGFAGIDIFFVLSGFIIWTTNIGKKTPVQTLRYLYRRLARIFLGYWPFFFLALAVYALWVPQRIERSWLLGSFLLVPAPGRDVLLGVSWTLSYELYFYIMFVFALLARRRFRLLVAATAALLVLNLYMGLVLGAFDPSNYRSIGFLPRFFTSPWLFEFFLGCFVAHGVSRGWRRFGRTFVCIGVVTMALAAATNAWMFDGTMAQSLGICGKLALFGGAGGALVYGLVAMEIEGTPLFPRFSEVFGGASYTIYLSHTILFDVANGLGIRQAVRDGPFPALLAYVLLLVFVLGFSAVFYLRVEAPLYSFAKSLFPSGSRRRTRSEPADGQVVGAGAGVRAEDAAPPSA